jgi:serine/threonine protein kinase
MRAASTPGYVTIRPLAHEDSVLYFPPEAFGPFRVLHQIGAGTLGPVFRAHEPGRDRLVAVKIFRLDITPEQSAVLVREFDQLIAKDITHRNVAAPIAAGIDGYAAYLAVQYVVGDSLDVASRAAVPMPLADVVRIVDGIASAIDACAARGVHHGLLHPRDVIMSADGPRVTGFGIAEALTRLGLRLPIRRPYAAPEGASDVYSLAAIAYELISGRRMTPTGWDELSAEDGPELRDAFAAGLSPDPQERPGSAGEFAAKLRAGGGSGKARPAYVADHDIVALPPFVEEVVAPPEPEFDTDAIDRFADLGAASDLHLDIAAPLEAEEPVPSSWTAQPPRAFLGEEPEPEPGGGRRFVTLAVIALIVAAVAGYAAYRWKAGRPAAAAVAQTAQAKPPVGATTVDLPPPAKPSAPTVVPPEPALPAPAPSRPASGITPAPARAPVSGRLLIRSSPADAVVSINGEPRGKTPLTVRDLAPGSYTIHVTRNGFVAADRRVRLTARQPSESIEISLKPLAPAPAAPSAGGDTAGSLSVESRPAGARVFVNDRLIGSTPLAMPDVPAGPATVRIEMDGYQAWITTVRVIAGQPLRVAASLDRR